MVRLTRLLLVCMVIGSAACSTQGGAATTPIGESAVAVQEAPATSTTASSVASTTVPAGLAFEAEQTEDAGSADTVPSAGAAATFSSEHLMLGPGGMFSVVDDPVYVAATSAAWLEPDDVVLGVVRGDVAVAFPVMQMAYHHIANVQIAGEPYLVTY